MTFKKLPSHMKPREKALMTGLSKLSDIELLALFLRAGSDKENVISLASRIISTFGSLSNARYATIDELKKIRGIGMVKSLEIKALFEFNNRMINNNILHSDKDFEISRLLLEQNNDLSQENFIVILFGINNEVIHFSTLYKGSKTELLVEPKNIISLVLKTNAYYFKCFHNHPSGSLIPSEADVSLTRRIKFLSLSMNIKFRGHYIFDSLAKLKKIVPLDK
ncbi:MAG: DNA repair protein RadC [Mycoplasmataceae bacterium]|nr:DNA repair protein RadC [Mycoplasmataceae bacterium]